MKRRLLTWVALPDPLIGANSGAWYPPMSFVSSPPSGLRVGVDSGGTFTDIAIYDPASGALAVWKVSSTPHDPSEGIVAGVGQGLAEQGFSGADVAFLGHGTTVATNALIEQRFARTGLVTTHGFRDVIEVGRQMRPRLYDVQVEKVPPVVSRDLRLEVVERLRFDGAEEAPLDEAGLRVLARQLKAARVEAVAICFLFSFLDPAHEQAAARIIAEEFPGVYISASHAIAPEIREYERFSTTTVNAALGPVMKAYLDRLTPGLAAIGVGPEPRITQSNGGIISAANAARQPVRTVLSGPAAGVMAALALGTRAATPDIITFDMGGTSTDVALIDKGRPQVATDLEVHGRPIKSPMLDIHTVGAGGGSIAFVDEGGHLKVGPRSAAASPGPVCYGLGNEEPTVTDANVVLQTLNPTHLLAGRMPIDRPRAVAAIGRLAEQLGLGVMETAQGILSVVTANMARAIRVISVERGYDPRDYALMAFGGAGPLHAARLARELGIGRILVPRSPGIACALGLLVTDLKTNFATGRLLRFSDQATGALEAAFAGLEAQAAAWFTEEAIAPADRSASRSLDMRYAGQGHELSVPCPAGPLDAGSVPVIRAAFEAAHRHVYGFVAPDEAVEIVTLRLEATGRVAKADLPAHPPAGTPAAAAVTGTRDVWLPESGGATPCPLIDRERLGPGHVIAGPAIIDQMDSTTLLLPGQVATVDAWLNLIIEDRELRGLASGDLASGGLA